MRTILLILFSLQIAVGHGQMELKFDKTEVRNAIALCNSFSFIEVLKEDAEIMPAGFHRTYTSTATATDNLFQVYKSKNVGYIVFRGSTSNMNSWMQNMSAAMIPAKGKIQINSEFIEYNFANDTVAAVHSGYALGVVIMSKEIINQIKSLNEQGVFDIIITGHSQGGALSILTRAFLENTSKQLLSSQNTYKTYAFASPLVGNADFSAEYKGRFCSNQSSFSVINPSDPVPNFPMGFLSGESSESSIFDMLNNKGSSNMKGLLLFELFRYMQDTIANVASNMGNSIIKQISSQMGEVVLPPYSADITYGNHCNTIEINPVPSPKVLINPEILDNDSLMAIYSKDEEGYFTDLSLYKPVSQWYQHKPYNYYTSILQMYFPKEYDKLTRLYPPGTDY